MSFRYCAGTLAITGTLVLWASVRGQSQAPLHAEPADIELFTADNMKWQKGPPSLPKGEETTHTRSD